MPMSKEQQQLEAGMAALEAQRGLLGDAVVDSALGPMRARLAALQPVAFAPPPEPTQTLKQVSILFLDVVGSTTLSQRLDPEAIGEVMDGALSRGTRIVAEHRGKVLQYAGDNLLAVFGADESREDDAERAVRCGLALLALGQSLGAEVQSAHGHAGFDVRVGIHTGGVLLGGGVDEDGSIRGIAVNIAARMEQTAPAGALRISQDTYTQVRGVFDVDPQEPLTVKGVDIPVVSYLVQRAKPRAFHGAARGIEGVDTRMIGRDAELAALQSAFKRLFVDRTLAAVTVVAEAGIGKSRLLREFDAWAEARPEHFLRFRGRATPQTQSQPYGLLRDILARHLQIADDDTVESARTKMELGIVPLFLHDDGTDLAEGHAHLLGHLIGVEWRDSRHVRDILEDSRQIRDRAFHTAAQIFRRVSAGEGPPVVLELEDLHWADDTTLDFLNYLAEIDRDVPLLILAISRPTLFERRTDWKSIEGIHQRVDLTPLNKIGSRLLVNELLKRLPQIPAALYELVTGGSEGNPFYMEELIRMLIDQGAIETRTETSGDWRVNAERLRFSQVPATLTGVLQARLDSLPAPERLTLQEASVIGPVFWDRALVAIDERARETLPALVRRELALPRAGSGSNSASDELREYAFKHAILHQVTYATVLKRMKHELHSKLAHWLAAQTGLRAKDFLGVAANHFEQAGDVANAAEFHARAAEFAKNRMAHDAVLDHVGRALALIDHAPDAGTLLLRWRLLEARETTLDMQGNRVAQRSEVEAMEAVAEALGDDRRRALAAWRRSVLSQHIADYPAMEAAARQAVEWSCLAGDVELRLISQQMLATTQAIKGDLAAGKQLTQETLVEVRALGLRRVEASCLNTLGIIARAQADTMAMHELLQQGLVATQATADRRAEAIALGSVGVSWLNLGALSQARSDMEEGLRLIRVNGDRAAECSLLCALSVLARFQGDHVRALELAQMALKMALAVRARSWEVASLCRLGEAELSLGRYAAAAQAFEQSRAVAISIDSALQHDAAAGLARVALAQGDSAAAIQAVDPLLALDAETGSVGGALVGCEFPRLIELTCHNVLVRAGDPRAAVWLRRAHEALQASAARITDAGLRQSFLQNIPHLREIVAAWSARRGDAG